MAIKITDKITPEGKKLIKEISNLSSLCVKVGFRSGSNTEEDGADVCQVATWNEFGTTHIPPRPFLRQSVENRKSEISSYMAAQKKKFLKGTGAKNILNEIGLFQKKNVQAEITEGSFVPNAPSTIKIKGSSRPLIDTGTMRQSVQYFVTKKGEDD